MNVKELIELLSKCDGNDDVLISIDEEGNGFHPLGKDGVQVEYNWNGAYQAEIGLRTLTEDQIKEGYTDEDTMDGYPCVILWP